LASTTRFSDCRRFDVRPQAEGPGQPGPQHFRFEAELYFPDPGDLPAIAAALAEHGFDIEINWDAFDEGGPNFESDLYTLEKSPTAAATSAFTDSCFRA
jgi:hypothetical protein